MSLPSIQVLRLSHRRNRDPRITTHVALTARALGADRMLLAGDVDEGVIDGVASVVKRFGGDFAVIHQPAPIKWLRNFCQRDAGDGRPGIGVHLTMYGQPFRETIPQIEQSRPIVFVVGGAKVDREVYDICQWNIAVGNQPHSEVAALALALYEWNTDADLSNRFEGGMFRIEPQPRGKKVTGLLDK